MEKVVYLHTTKKTAEVFREFAREDVHVVELEHAEDLRDFLAWADLAILHAPSLREKLLPVIHQIFSCEKKLFVAVFVEEMKPDFSQDLIALGVRDVIDCGAPLPVIRQRIRNLLDLLKAEKNDERWSPEQAGESIHLTSVIEALKNVPGLSQALKRAEDPIASFLHFSSSLLGVTRLCLLGEKENRLKVISSLGLPEKLAEEISFSLAEGAAYYLKNEFCILRKDIPSDSPSWKQAVEEMKSVNMEVLVPVMDRGRLKCALGVSRKMSGRKFTEGDMALLVYLARLVPELMDRSLPEAVSFSEKPFEGKPEENIIPSPVREPERDVNMAFVRTLAMRSSHELKNALVSIKTFTQLLPKKYKSESFRKDFFSVVSKEVDHLNALVEELLFFSQPVTLMKENKDVLKAIRDVTREFTREFKSVYFNYTVDEALSSQAFFDEKHLRTAFWNILKNSAESMKGEGTITISFRKEEPESRLGCAGLIMQISDSGEGLPEKAGKKIFDPFFTTKTKGLGLGLTIAQKIIHAHGWTLHMEGMEKGAAAKIFIPPAEEKNQIQNNKTEPNGERFMDRLLEYEQT